MISNQINCFTYSKGELHHGQNVDPGCLPICGYTLFDLLRLQTAHDVVFVSGQAHFRPQNICEGCEESTQIRVKAEGDPTACIYSPLYKGCLKAHLSRINCICVSVSFKLSEHRG